MVLVYFRYGDSDENYDVGIAIAVDMKDLFWQIDFHCDPYAIKLIPIESATSILYNITNTVRDKDGYIEGYETGEVEPFETFPDFDDERWVTPKWPDYAYLVSPRTMERE